MEVFSGLSLRACREEMAVFKGRGDTISLHNYVSLVFMDLFSQDEKDACSHRNSVLLLTDVLLVSFFFFVEFRTFRMCC